MIVEAFLLYTPSNCLVAELEDCIRVFVDEAAIDYLSELLALFVIEKSVPRYIVLFPPVLGAIVYERALPPFALCYYAALDAYS